MRIHGAGKKLYVGVPVTVQKLIFVEGALAGNPDGTKIDLAVRDRLDIDELHAGRVRLASRNERYAQSMWTKRATSI